MKKLIYVVVVLFFFAGCSKDDDVSDVNIRLFNASEFELEDIEFNPSTGLVNFGDLNPNQYSEYQNFGRAYRYAYIRITVDGSNYTLQPNDYVGETPLDNGNYTYRLNFNNDDKLTFLLVED